MPKVLPPSEAAAVYSSDIAILRIPPSQPSSVRKTRFRLWELQECWHCMVVGTCLTLAEVRQSASKGKIPVASKSDYCIHQLAVGCAADKKHPLTQRLQKLLERKFAMVIKHFRSARTVDELKDCWTKGWEAGEVASSLWALITHPLVSRELITEAFGQVHMLSHLSGASVCVDKRLRLKQEGQNSTLTRELKALKARYDSATSMLRECTSQLAIEKDRVAALESALERVTAQKQEACALKAVNVEVEQGSAPKVSDNTHLIASLRDKNQKLRKDAAVQRTMSRRKDQEIERFKRLVSAYENRTEAAEHDSLKLCGQCVLYLGGKLQQRRHFQALVESSEGRFLHHDGGREACTHRIAELVSQADVVMCPTDCISHSAMEKARSLCAKQDKPMVFMQRSSLSSFTRSLQEALGEEKLP